MSSTLRDTIEIVGIITNALLVYGVFAAFRQVKAAQESLKAQVLIKVFDEWRDVHLYRAMTYVNRLRDEWKAKPTSEWTSLAEKWVAERAGKRANGNDEDQRLWNEWEMRRTASQCLAKMGSLIESGYLSEDDFFGVDPEVGRQLAVLIYLERAVQSHWAQREQNPVASWDRPFPKWEFNSLWIRYQEWYSRHGRDKLILHPLDWSTIHTATGR